MKKRHNYLALGAFLFGIICMWLLYPGQGVPILAYHMINDQEEEYTVRSGDFESQMHYLTQQGYTAISLSEYFAAAAGGPPLPAKPVIITFDDGYEDNLTVALPIMKKYGLKGTVFVITSTVGQPGYLTWEQIRALRQQQIEIGSHTVNHVALRELSPNERLPELRDSKLALEKQLGSPVEFLAYPFGSYDKELFALLKQLEYRGACTGLPGLNSGVDSPYALRRINVPQPKYGLWEFRLRLLRAQLYSKLGL